MSDHGSSTLDEFLYDCKQKRIQTTAHVVNCISQCFIDCFGKVFSEKRIQATMSTIKAQRLVISNSWDDWITTWGIGVCVNAESGVVYITSREMQEAGKYVILQQDSHNIIKPVERLNPLNELQEPFVKDLIYAFGDDQTRLSIKNKLRREVGTNMQKLENDFPGLLSAKLRKELTYNVDPVYHLSGLMRVDNFKALIQRILKESRVKQLDLDEDIKNDPEALRKSLNSEILHSVATEVRSGIEKIMVYITVWQDSSESFRNFLRKLINGIEMEKPSEEFLQHLSGLLPVLVLRRCIIGYVRSQIFRHQNSPEHYERFYTELIETCLRKGIDIYTLYCQYYGRLSND